MIDLHSHILPQMDDGSASVEESTALLARLAAQGVTTAVATPHFYPSRDTPEAFLARRKTCAEKLGWPEENTPRLLLGAEVAYYAGISRSTEIEDLQIGDTGLLLLEMPFGDWTDAMVEEVCDLSEQRGLRPVLAHVNRYCTRTQLKRYKDLLLDRGVYFQCNPEGLLEGWNRRYLRKLLSEGNIHFLGSDCHNLTDRPPRLGQAAQEIRKKLGAEALDALNAVAAELLGVQ